LKDKKPAEKEALKHTDRLRPIDADLQVPDTSKFTTHTGWRPLIPYEQSLADLLDYWRDRVAQDGDSFLTR